MTPAPAGWAASARAVSRARRLVRARWGDRHQAVGRTDAHKLFVPTHGHWATSPHLAGLRYLHLRVRGSTPRSSGRLLERGALPGLLCPDLRGNRVPAEVIARLRTRSLAMRGRSGWIYLSALTFQLDRLLFLGRM
jgi:hypothetical protein